MEFLLGDSTTHDYTEPAPYNHVIIRSQINTVGIGDVAGTRPDLDYMEPLIIRSLIIWSHYCIFIFCLSSDVR